MLATFLRELHDIHTTPRHQRMLLGEATRIAELVKRAKEPTWSMIYSLLRLVSRLLGYDYLRSAKCHTLEYWQSTPQHHNTVVFEGGDIMQDYYDRKNAIALRQFAASTLRSAGHSEHMIALALNTTEYEFRKLKREEE